MAGLKHPLNQDNPTAPAESGPTRFATRHKTYQRPRRQLRARTTNESTSGGGSTLENAHRDTPPKKPVTAPARRQIFVESGVTEGGDVSMRARGGGLARRDCGVAVGYFIAELHSDRKTQTEVHVTQPFLPGIHRPAVSVPLGHEAFIWHYMSTLTAGYVSYMVLLVQRHPDPVGFLVAAPQPEETETTRASILWTPSCATPSRLSLITR
jgi:hypothetical protein